MLGVGILALVLTLVRCQLPCTGFQCEPEGDCIPSRWHCDGAQDCPSGNDEQGCLTCSEGYYKCEGINTVCIMEHWICNGFLDCPGGEDELYCVTGPSECSEDQFTCNDGRCINLMFRCDGLYDCFRGEDEENCESCSEGYRCSDNTCIPDIFVCDQQEDCDGGEDELICDCSPSDYLCQDGHCIPPTWVCDGYYDCFGGEDEDNCTNAIHHGRSNLSFRIKAHRKLGHNPPPLMCFRLRPGECHDNSSPHQPPSM